MRENVIIKMLDPDSYYLLKEFCKSEGFNAPNPDFSKVMAAIDLTTEKVIGIVATQMKAHSEPIWLKKEYQGNGIAEELCDAMEGYLDTLAYGAGVQIEVYNQPTNVAAERICRMRNYQKSDHPLWVKVYGVTKSNLGVKEE